MGARSARVAAGSSAVIRQSAFFICQESAAFLKWYSCRCMPLEALGKSLTVSVAPAGAFYTPTAHPRLAPWARI